MYKNVAKFIILLQMYNYNNNNNIIMITYVTTIVILLLVKFKNYIIIEHKVIPVVFLECSQQG